MGGDNFHNRRTGNAEKQWLVVSGWCLVSGRQFLVSGLDVGWVGHFQDYALGHKCVHCVTFPAIRLFTAGFTRPSACRRDRTAHPVLVGLVAVE